MKISLNHCVNMEHEYGSWKMRAVGTVYCEPPSVLCSAKHTMVAHSAKHSRVAHSAKHTRVAHSAKHSRVVHSRTTQAAESAPSLIDHNPQ